ncbi:MAG TPA: sulfotransferase [Herpetosiphonaceae bacterium]
MTIKVIGAGFGRTGTSSLQAALEQLGFGKCYHMREVFAHPEHARIWLAASQGKSVDWDALLAGYQATVDWPGCTFYREMMAHYPDAKVLLSVRDADRWHQSALNTIYGFRRNAPPKWLWWLKSPSWRLHRRMGDSIIWDGTFGGRFEDKHHAISIFKRHNAEVQRAVPAERLLVYDVKQGWEPLCRFLGVPVPDTPFPHLNDTAEFQRMLRQRLRSDRLALNGALMLVMLGLGLLVWLRQRWSE